MSFRDKNSNQKASVNSNSKQRIEKIKSMAKTATDYLLVLCRLIEVISDIMNN